MGEDRQFDPKQQARYDRNRIELEPLFVAYQLDPSDAMAEDDLLRWLYAEIYAFTSVAYRKYFRWEDGDHFGRDTLIRDRVDDLIRPMITGLRDGSFPDFVRLLAYIRSIKNKANANAVEKLKKLQTPDQRVSRSAAKRKAASTQWIPWSPALDAVISTLSPEDQQFTVLLELYGHDVKALADRFGSNYETMRKRRYRLRLDLEARLNLAA